MVEDISVVSAVLERLRAIIVVMSGGMTLADWLVAETDLEPEVAAIAVEEYRRFLALALTATPEAPIMPSPRVGMVWYWHRNDSAAWAVFRSLVDRPDHLVCRRSRYTLLDAPAYDRTRERYKVCFGQCSRDWWPSKLQIRLIRNFGRQPDGMGFFWIVTTLSFGLPMALHRYHEGGGSWWLPGALLAAAAVGLVLRITVAGVPLSVRRKFAHQAELAGPV